MQRCWDVIDAQAEIALKSEGFTDIDFHTLQTILNRETLNCKEIVVFQVESFFYFFNQTRILINLLCRTDRLTYGRTMNKRYNSVGTININ